LQAEAALRNNALNFSASGDQCSTVCGASGGVSVNAACRNGGWKEGSLPNVRTTLAINRLGNNVARRFRL
jgi:hypothetical protein